ncbi:hypothetical protein L345_03778, partial [Ophiophagus hannah]
MEQPLPYRLSTAGYDSSLQKQHLTSGTCFRIFCAPTSASFPAMKSKFSTVASVHVYSIQKAQLRDSSPLFNTDYDILKANLENCGK